MPHPTENDQELFDVSRYSVDVQTVMSAPPTWIVRWGVSLIFLIILALFSVSYFVKYPDMVKSSFTLGSVNPSARVIANESGNITLLVGDRSTVKKGEVLGYIENPADYQDVCYLRSLLDSMKRTLTYEYLNDLTLKPNVALGELQDVYIYFSTNLEAYKNYVQEGKLKKIIGFIDQQRTAYRRIGQTITRQDSILQQQNSISFSKLKRDSFLLAEKVISKLDIENSGLSYLPSEMNIENSKQANANNALRLIELDNRKAELTLQELQYLNDLRTKVVSSFADLERRFASWQTRFLFIAPINGTNIFFDVRSSNQYVSSGKELFVITPTSEQEPLGTCLLPVENSGKVRVGQDVNIDLTNFPANEYGLLTGKIRSISPVPQDGKYFVVIELTNGLHTDFKKNVEFKEQMTGMATIKTEDLRLIERFFYSLRKAISNNK